MIREPAFDVLMERLRAGDEDAAARVFNRFARRLILLARDRLGRGLRRKEDAGDVLQSVFRSFFTRYRGGQLQFDSWEGLWGILTLITLHKCGNRVEYFHAARRDVRREVSLPAADESRAAWEAVARGPGPVEAAALTGTLERLMAGLDERDREVLTLCLQGYTMREVGEQVSRAERTVRRVLERVRRRLRELQAAEDRT